MTQAERIEAAKSTIRGLRKATAEANAIKLAARKLKPAGLQTVLVDLLHKTPKHPHADKPRWQTTFQMEERVRRSISGDLSEGVKARKIAHDILRRQLNSAGLDASAIIYSDTAMPTSQPVEIHDLQVAFIESRKANGEALTAVDAAANGKRVRRALNALHKDGKADKVKLGNEVAFRINQDAVETEKKAKVAQTFAQTAAKHNAAGKVPAALKAQSAWTEEKRQHINELLVQYGAADYQV